MMIPCLPIWLILSIIVIHSKHCIYGGINDSPGETLPPRLEIEVNSSANITCRMNPNKIGGNVNSSSLYFEQEDTEYILPKENIHIINETTIVYMLRNASEQDRYYICKIGFKGIGITHVSVGTAPLDITDFKCRGFDYTYMVCNFTKPQNVLLTQYNLSYTAQSPFLTSIMVKGEKRLYRTIYSQNYIQICHLEIQQNQGICNMTMEKNNYRPNYEFYNFTLKGQNEVGVNVQSFWINHYESVIPPRPDYTFVEVTNNTVVIKWNNPKYSFYSEKGLEYEIRLKPEGSHWVYPKKYEIRNNRSDYILTVRNLPYAYFWYEISVRLRVKKASHNDENYWSASYIQKFQTSACAPDTPPITDVGSFYIDSSETKVRLYWKKLPSNKENGPNFKYVIKEVKRDGVNKKLKPLHIDRTSATFTWNKRQNYSFILKSSNAEGESPINSTILVPAWSKHNKRHFSPQWIRNVYHAVNRTSTLSWSPPHNQKYLVDYTVFWCHSKHATTTECEDTVVFQHVNKESTLFNISPQKQDEIFNLAVSANYRDFNTGMHWTMCSADATSELIKLEPEIIDIKNRSITIQWSADRVCSSVVEGYMLIYCSFKRSSISHIKKKDESTTHNCLEEPTKLTIPHTTRKYTINNLKPFSTYKIQMYMFSKLKPGNLSEAQIINTLEDAPSKPYNLGAYNVTSNSVVLFWSQPEYQNGILRKYRIAYNNEHHTINCQTDEKRCALMEIEHKLENLSSYTTYKIYIIAYTTAPSDNSNDITIKTLVGIPSNPRNVKTKDSTQNILQWSRPEVPSGRVEFYEVAITLWFKDEIKRRHISGIINVSECEFRLPVCIDADYRFTKEVRAVNVVRRDTEIDHYIFVRNNGTNDYFNDNYIANKDLRCIGTTVSAKEQLRIIHKYQDNHKYVQYKSVWENGPVTNCSDPKLNRITMLALLIIVSSLGVMAAFYVARNKYQKMANISCALPPGLEAMAYPSKDNGDGGDIFQHSKDLFYHMESSRLLSPSIYDSACPNGVHNNDNNYSCTLERCSGSVGSNICRDYCHQETFVAADTVSGISGVFDKTSVVDDAYLVMKLLKPNDNNLNAFIPTTTNDKIMVQSDSPGFGYVQSSLTDKVASSVSKNSVIPLPITKVQSLCIPIDNGYIKQTPKFLMSENGYVKPNTIFNWPIEQMTQQTTVALSMSNQNITTALPIKISGYLAPQLLQKLLIPSYNAYTSVEDLGKSQSITSKTFINPDEGGVSETMTTNLSPISGYVTQKDLSAFGQHHKLN